MNLVARISEAVVNRGGKEILGPISFDLYEGQRWVILGPNGAGKSTILKLLATEIFPSKGSVELLGHQLGRVDVFDLRTRIEIGRAHV